MKHRKHNIGKSDYAEHKIQPWDIWREYNLDPWRADIVKRILRTKEGANEIEELDKIKHICDELIAHVSTDEHTGQTKMNLDDERPSFPWTDEEAEMLKKVDAILKHTRTKEELEVMQAVADSTEGSVVDMKGVSIERFMEMRREDEQ